MYLELVDALRCLRPHQPTALVASVERVVDRDVITGTLGCPLCDARYPIVEGAVVFDPACRPPDWLPAAGPPAGAAETATRVAALLDLTDANGVVLLHGSWADAADAVSRIAPVAMVLLNPTGRTRADGARGLLYAPVAPLAPGAVRAAAIDGPADPALVESVVRAVRPGGRLMGPAGVAVPVGVRELARDADGWVGERLAAAPATPEGPPVTLRRR
jgi:hypothetical protein